MCVDEFPMTTPTGWNPTDDSALSEAAETWEDVRGSSLPPGEELNDPR
jgi:hypothetical protein